MISKNAPLLVVEDDDDDLNLILDSIKSLGLERPVRTAGDGLQAIDYLSGKGAFSDRERHPLPWLLLLDIKMPGADGFEVLSWLRQTAKIHAMPVIMLSGSAQDKDILRCYTLGANAFLVKPSSLATLKEMMGAIKSFWCDFNHLPDNIAAEIHLP